MSPEIVVKNRWLGFLIWQSLLSAAVFLLVRTLISLFLLPTSLPAPVSALLSLPFFLLSLLLFSLSLFLVSSPHPDPTASPFELALALLRFFFYSVVSGSDSPASDPAFRRRARASLGFLGCVMLCGASGFLSAMAVSGGSGEGGYRWWKMVGLGLRGAVFGLVYGGYFVYAKRWVLRFPIIQRPIFFSFKMGLLSSLKQAFKLSSIAFICTTIFLLFLPNKLKSMGTMGLFLIEQIVFYLGISVVSFCWELSSHLLQVLHTRRCYFAPPKGSAAAETNPSEPLLAALEQSTPRSLHQYLAYLDLCMVCESNVDTWRRAAFFEETGDTYRRAVIVCTRPLEQLTSALSEGLEGTLRGKPDALSRQLYSPTDTRVDPKLHEEFNNFQLYAWCARILSALTACSHNEDRFGVAQLTGCNASVVSALLSCLIAVEACLGKKTNPRSEHMMGPANIKWATVSTGNRNEQSSIAGKKKGGPLHSKAYTMSDVLRTSIYEIVSVFHDEMQSSLKASSLEKDWIIQDKPLYGSREALVQKLSQFLDFCAC